MTRYVRWALLVLVLLTAACGGSALRWEPTVHEVSEGETLYAIAWRYQIDSETLARWNGLSEGATLRPGQKLRLYEPAPGQVARAPQPSAGSSTRASRAPSPPAAAGPVAWRWPADGELAAGFGDATSLGKGIDIRGRVGDPVVAASDGEVVYSGSGLIGYGKLIIVKHNNAYLSAYGHNSALLVDEGDSVRSGQRIARMGQGPGQQPVLHFEIRLNGKPVDPLRYLPPP